MKTNFTNHKLTVDNSNDIAKMEPQINNILENTSLYIDEVILNIYLNTPINSFQFLKIFENYRFGTYRRLPLVNLFLNKESWALIYDLENDIQNFITPVLIINAPFDIPIEEISNFIICLNKKHWKPHISLSINSIDDFAKGINFYKKLSCEFFDIELYIIFDLTENIEILEFAYHNIRYIQNTIKFLGMRDNLIVDCLLKAIREKELGIQQSFKPTYKTTITKLMHENIINLYEKHTLIRNTMDDFALK